MRGLCCNGFQSTHPVRGGTWISSRHTTPRRISIHPPRAGWDEPDIPRLTTKKISIHPPRAGWDDKVAFWESESAISIHPPRAGWDQKGESIPLPLFYFSPPTPCGVGLLRITLVSYSILHFNPPTPCGVGLLPLDFTPTASRFQSTHPVRGGTILESLETKNRYISIHPPRAGWDRSELVRVRAYSHFNPPTPCGVGLLYTQMWIMRVAFQSTHPVRGGTWIRYLLWDTNRFQSTHPVRGGTIWVTDTHTYP